MLVQNAESYAAELQEVRRSVLLKRQERGETASSEEGLRKVRREVEECRKTVDLIYNEVQSKLSLKEYEADLIEIRKRFESVTKEVGIKANIKDVCVLADSKPSTYCPRKTLTM